MKPTSDLFKKLFPRIRTGVSTRTDGNMARSRPQAGDAVVNRRRFFNKKQIDPQRAAVPNTVRGNKVAKISASDLGKGVFTGDAETMHEADGLVSDLPGTTLFIPTADCAVISCWDKDQTVVGAAHSGWRGTEDNIAKELLGVMAKDPKDLYALVSGSICKDCYLFRPGSDHELLKLESWAKYRETRADGSVGIDVARKVLDQLRALGLSEERIFLPSDICSAHSKDEKGEKLYFSNSASHKEGPEAQRLEGRFITYISLLP